MKRFLLLSCCAGSSLFALLPPLAQSEREIQALLSDSQLQTLLGSAEQIQEVIRTENGYVVLTQNYLLRVDIEYQKALRPGPAQFQFRFQDPILLRGDEPREDPN